MNISKNIKIIDLALLLKDNMIIADTHIGYEEALNKQGLLVPRFQFKELIQRLEAIFQALSKNNCAGACEGLSPKLKAPEAQSPLLKSSKNEKNHNRIIKNKKFLNKIIINGDIKHEFGTISEQEWRHTLKLIDFLSKHCKQLILIKGNHDTILGPIAKKRKVKVMDSITIGNTLIIHGHKLPKKIDKKIKRIIIAHEHPAISIKDATRTELFKCFLKGKYKNKELIVQPSFNIVTEGTDILKEEILSPFLKQDLSNFEVIVIADKIYNFGKLKEIN